MQFTIFRRVYRRSPGGGADTIARKWIWCVENLGSQWTIEKILCSSTGPEAVIEWTHWKRKMSTALRGDEWYVFDLDSGRIAEIRAYYASPADPSVNISELVDFEYAGRGYHRRAHRCGPTNSTPLIPHPGL